MALGAEEPVGSSWNPRSQPDPTTDSQGRFVLTRVAREVNLVRTDDLDLLRQGEAELHAENGDVRDLVLHVVRGGSIEGTVRWPDGSFADHFEVEILDSRHSEEDGEGGRFRLLGLPRGSYRLEARAARAGVTGRASALGVETDGPPLELILEEAPACELRGLVVDGSDAPVPKFWVNAYLDAEVSNSASADGYSGHFQLSGLVPDLARQRARRRTPRGRIARRGHAGGPRALLRAALRRPDSRARRRCARRSRGWGVGGGGTCRLHGEVRWTEGPRHRFSRTLRHRGAIHAPPAGRDREWARSERGPRGRRRAGAHAREPGVPPARRLPRPGTRPRRRALDAAQFVCPGFSSCASRGDKRAAPPR